MKNREKFRDEIVEAIKEDNDENGKMCCFLKDNVIPRFVSEEDMEWSVCADMNCYTCVKIFAFWLDEEYEEPPKPEVDWSKVPVDTLVRVRDRAKLIATLSDNSAQTTVAVPGDMFTDLIHAMDAIVNNTQAEEAEECE